MPENNVDPAQLPAAVNNSSLLLENDWDKATSDRDFIYIPNQPPRKRKHKNRWTDANEQDIARHLLTDKVENMDTTNPALLVGQNPELI